MEGQPLLLWQARALQAPRSPFGHSAPHHGLAVGRLLSQFGRSLPNMGLVQVLEIAIIKPEPSSILGITCDPNPDGPGVKVAELTESRLHDLP